MYDLKQSLLACGYCGPCENLNLLKWAIRAGASSQFFNDLIYWLESQLDMVITTQQVRDNITRLFSMLRHSILMKPSYGSEAAVNPKEFRLQTIKVLVRQLQLRKLPEQFQQVNAQSPQGDQGNVPDYRRLTVTLNLNRKSNTGDWNQRLVRCNANLLEI
ncbi:hypothetical protein FF38_10106 [Lucilia cuprina]|uniref:Uncharacterized protein n=1 Tax=Lucilia cuprina TaxID=7375 RepID=A0A0L0CPT1_LUCCU|nr:hypothetical protein FF38_10106 [Lucilia cuprina]